MEIMKRLEMNEVFNEYMFAQSGGGRYLAPDGWYPLLGLPGAIDTHRGAILFCQLQKPVEAEVKKFCLNGVIEKIRIHRSARVHTLDTMLVLASDLFHEFEVCQTPMMSDTEVEGFVGAIVDRHGKPSTTTTTIQPTPVGSEVDPPEWEALGIDNKKLSEYIARTQTPSKEKQRATESNSESLKLLNEIMQQQKQKDPALKAKQDRLLRILGTSREQQDGSTPSGAPTGPTPPDKMELLLRNMMRHTLPIVNEPDPVGPMPRTPQEQQEQQSMAAQSASLRSKKD
jgi:hypothetical protein